MSLTLSECQDRIKYEKDELNAEVKSLKKDMDKISDEMEKLKKALYGKFGKSINLER